VNPATADQQALRNAFLLFTTEWSNLTEGERTAWETARTGNVYYLKQDPLTGVSRPFASAKDLFIAMNLNRTIADGSILTPSVYFTTPGTSAGLDSIAVSSVVADDSSNSVIVTWTGTATNETLVFKATPPQSPGTSREASVSSKYRYISILGTSPDTIAEYIAKFGALTGQTGNKIFWKVEGVEITTGKSRVINSGVSAIVA
jgi:hypothetical protein